jgi:hypothetical protein
MKRDKALTRVGDSPLLNDLAALTPAEIKLLDAATTIQQNPDATEAAYMARQLVPMHAASS